MMIVGVRSYGSIVKLLVCMLVFLGFIGITNAAGGGQKKDGTYVTCGDGQYFSVFADGCIDSESTKSCISRGGVWIDGSCIEAPPCPADNPNCKDKKTTNVQNISTCSIYPSGSEEYKLCASAIEGQKYFETDLGKCEKRGYSKSYCICKYDLKGIYLNTEVPFVGAPGNPRCLVMSTAGSAPSTVLQSLTKILMTFVMIGGFGMIVWGGVQIAAGDVKGGKEKIIGVVIAFALLGSLGVILRFINPNFFS